MRDRPPTPAPSLTCGRARGVLLSDGYDNWIDLVSKMKKTEDGNDKDPAASIMDMMKDMYDQGDDTMKKTIGEAMMKSRRKEAMGDMSPDMPDMPKM